MKDKQITNQAGELLLGEYVNISETCTLKSTWSKKWGEIVEDTLYLYPSNKPNAQAQHTIKVKGVEIHPAAKETGLILAFKLISKEKCILVLEPLNIRDMGRWISSLFAAIQGFYISNNLLITETSKSKEDARSSQAAKTSSIHDERPGFLVNVRSLAKKFEQLAVTENSEKQQHEIVKRSVSTPNLQAQTEKIVILSNSSEINGEGRTETKAVIKTTVNEVQQASFSGNVRHSRGPYMAQDEEKAVLDQAKNPYLAKRKLVKQEMQIQKLEATVKSITERITRQKKALGETKFAIQEFKSQSTDSQDRIDIIALEEQSAILQKQITQSELSIKDYNQTIHQLEDEMINLSKFISWDKHEGARVEQKEVKATDNNKVFVAVTLPSPTKENGSAPEAAGFATESSSDEEEELGMGAPAWAREAQRKSRAFKMLEKQGILK